jgi:hypothetical protein
MASFIVRSFRKKGRPAFCEQKAAKNFVNLDRDVLNARGPEEQKFFASFFQKRSAFFA